MSAALLGGTIFAWYTVYTDFNRFYQNEGTLFKIEDCAVPNPVTTACFYGAIAFLAAFIWSIFLHLLPVEMRQKPLRYLTIFLVGGVLFAWTNMTILLVKFYRAAPGDGVSCSGVPTANPFTTPCFYGATIFLLSLIIAIGALVLERRAGDTVISDKK